MLTLVQGQNAPSCNLVTCGDQTIIQGQSVQLSVSGATNYLWTPATGLSDPTSATPIASPTTTTTYSVTGYYYSEDNLVVNGDFSQGNTGFTSQYSYNSNLWIEGNYYVASNPNTYHEQFVGHGHTTGSDNFMMVNGSIDDNKVVWQETITVVPHTHYCFSAWVSALSQASLYPGLRPVLKFAINGDQVGNTFQSPSSLNTWENFYALWDSDNATQATITIVSMSYTALSGNDFGLDDISFFGIVECPNSQQLTVNVENRSGMVNVTATPSAICVGQSSQLHAEAVMDVIIDFETGDFSQFEFENDPTYPWTVVAANNGSSFCMKSGNAGVHSSTSSISATAYFVQDGYLSFSFLSKGENSNDSYDWDVSRFYIDDGIQFQYGLHTSWESFTADISAGIHTFTWVYKKDGTVNPPNDDAFFVDDITFSPAIPVNGLRVYGFEDHTFQGWTTIDADGDGYNWAINDYFGGHNGSSSIVFSQSFTRYFDYYTYEYVDLPLTPDNYLVAPFKMNVQQGAYISFWACNQDVSYPGFHGEHFGIAVSTTNNTNANAFTTIQEWTLAAKDYGQLSNMSRSGNRQQGNWHFFNVDLSAYAGQNIWVAIRHFGCTDEFYLDIDDITLNDGSSGSISDNYTYHWTPGNMTGQNITVSPTQTTTYTVTAVDENGIVVGTAQQTIVVEPIPEVNITTSTGENSICEGETITLSASVSGTDYILAGDILCDDGSIVHPSDWPCGKTAKAIVCYVDATGQHGWAIDLGQNVQPLKWSTENKDVPGLQSHANFLDAITDMDGYSNTQKIRSFGNNTKYPAAWAVDFDQGWYLPAIGQLNVLFGVYFAVNIGLETVGGTTISNVQLWSSSANTSEKSWMIRANNGYVWVDPKNANKIVRAVIDF